MKVVGCFKQEDGTLTPDMTAEEICEAYPEKTQKLAFKYIKNLLERAYNIEINLKAELK
ncbi:hypothetical protein BX659_13222 [Orenia metallireducens]|uniref:Uncharacterized protein n=1 Tax=Orenia metallireducens TaxID=1413210 RepID=A0A285ID52_9FIRM|nr:hypothetical protein [Orenia metallireducens]PRX21224.1 hypothetical protein BX659_13222 [Orenia metallireducens]SNY44986.1 hypothetical protein SAMN06265827_13622 [Orenia metallireducens]